jgi:predicted GNAT family N-acyltransferase
MASESKQYDWSDTNEALSTPQENELTTLTHSIIEWRRLKENGDTLKIQLRETNKKMKALEEIILRVMKSHNIGALDLKNSGGRVLFKKSKRQSGLGQKNMEKLVTEYLQSEEKAKDLMVYIQEHREVTFKESIHYEKTD